MKLLASLYIESEWNLNENPGARHVTPRPLITCYIEFGMMFESEYWLVANLSENRFFLGFNCCLQPDSSIKNRLESLSCVSMYAFLISWQIILFSLAPPTLITHGVNR